MLRSGVGDPVVFHAVLEATKSFAGKLRTARHGLLSICWRPTASAVSKAALPIFVNGTFGMLRNPTAHEARTLWAIRKEDAEDLLSLASLIHRRIDAATV